MAATSRRASAPTRNKRAFDLKPKRSGVDFSGRSLKLDNKKDAQPIIHSINRCPDLQYLILTGNTLGVSAAQAIAKALERHPELKIARFNNIFTGRMNTEIPPVLTALGDGMSEAGARLHDLRLIENALGPIGVEGVAKLLQSDVCSELQYQGNMSTKEVTIEPDLPRGYIGAFRGLQVAALPRLKELKFIYFGNCLLKSKGAKILAKSLKDSTVLKVVDLSHNRICREACMEVVDALMSLPDSADRLKQVELAGNWLESAGSKKRMKDKLGLCAELGDEESSEDEYTSDSDDEEVEEEEDESQADEDSATQDVQDPEIVMNKGEEISLDQSVTAEMGPNVGNFLINPTIENLIKLGENPADVLDEHLQLIPDQEAMTVAYVKALCCMSGLSGESATAAENSSRLCQTVVKRARPLWLLADTLLRALTLIKSDNKDFEIRWRVPACYSALAAEIDAPYFPAPLRDTLKFSVASKMTALPAEVRSVIYKHPNLYNLSCCCD